MIKQTTQPATIDRAAGFTLLEIAIVLAILGILGTLALGITGQLLAKQRRDTTLARLASIESAINLFVAQNKYLPCPAIGTLDGTAPVPDPKLGREEVAAGRASCSTALMVNQQTGIIPWVTLGIPAIDAQDGYGNMFTYRVDQSFVQTNSMDFTMCTPAGTNVTPNGTAPNFRCQPCTTATFPAACNDPRVVIAGRGLRVKAVSGALVADPLATPSTGAAYVVISHGESQGGAYQFTGTLNVGTVASGTEENNNRANAAYPAGSATAYLVEDFPSYGATTAHFDDFVLRASILGLATKAQMGPRAY